MGNDLWKVAKEISLPDKTTELFHLYEPLNQWDVHLADAYLNFTGICS